MRFALLVPSDISIRSGESPVDYYFCSQNLRYILVNIDPGLMLNMALKFPPYSPKNECFIFFD